jgi:tRNA-2-methylthio-N6-dimethylallyladenosine synthase
VDFVLGTMAIQQLPRIVDAVLDGQNHVVDTEEHPENHLFPFEVTDRRDAAKALVTIIEGCDHHCTYCVVPETRGGERHRPVEDILEEVRGAVGRGFGEIELLGQNVNSYHGGCSFAELLERVGELDGVEWIRFTTSHPMNFTPELAKVLVTNPKVAPFLHLPVQSGSDRVLRRMGRQYTADAYRERVGYLGEGRERMALSTDFIVGFPGETDEDFEDTMRLLDQLRFDASFSFAYSPRPGTPALRYGDEVPARVKSERLARLQKRQAELTHQSNRRLVGQELDVRIESRTPVEGGHWLARTGSWKNVHLFALEGAKLPFGRLLRARITDAGPHWLKAESVKHTREE